MPCELKLKSGACGSSHGLTVLRIICTALARMRFWGMALKGLLLGFGVLHRVMRFRDSGLCAEHSQAIEAISCMSTPEKGLGFRASGLRGLEFDPCLGICR